MCVPGLVEDVTHLLSRGWINRIWCLQETLLARNLVVSCGQKSIPWSDFSYGLTYLKYRKAHSKLALGKATAWLQLVSVRAQLHAAEDSPPASKHRRCFLLRASRRGRQESPLNDYYRAFGRLRYTFQCSLCSILVTFACCFLVDVFGRAPAAIAAPLTLVPMTFLGGALAHVVWERAVLPLSPIDAMVREIILRRATRPEDKVYGVQGILKEAFSLVLSTQAGTPPGEAQALSFLYQDLFTQLASRWKGPGRLLFYAKGLPREYDGDKWDGPSWVPDLQSSDTPWFPHPDRRLEFARLNTSRGAPPKSNLTEPQLVFSPGGRELTVQVLAVGRVTWASESGFSQLPVPIADERPDDHLSCSHVHNIHLLCEPWHMYKSSNPALRLKAAILRGSGRRPGWWDTAIQLSGPTGQPLNEAQYRQDWQWGRILDTWRSRSSGEPILQRLMDAGLFKLHVRRCNHLAANERRIFLMTLEKGKTVVVANGPFTIRSGDKIVKIT